MARKFTRISQDAFNEFAINSGMLLKTFDVSGSKDFTDEDIVCDTTGDITATCVPTYSDMGEDVNNCPDNMKELMHLDSWEAKLAFTALNVTPEVIRMALGAADIEGGKITPRMKLDTEKDFSDIWLVCDLDRNHAAQLAIVMQMSRQESRSSAGRNEILSCSAGRNYRIYLQECIS